MSYYPIFNYAFDVRGGYTTKATSYKKASRTNYEVYARNMDEQLTRVIRLSSKPNEPVFPYKISLIHAQQMTTGYDTNKRDSYESKVRANGKTNTHWISIIDTHESLVNQHNSGIFSNYERAIYNIIFDERNNNLNQLFNELENMLSIINAKHNDYRAVFYEDYDGYNRPSVA